MEFKTKEDLENFIGYYEWHYKPLLENADEEIPFEPCDIRMLHFLAEDLTKLFSSRIFKE